MAQKKKYKIRTGARRASKAQEKELLQKAKRLKKNPDLILPEYDEKLKLRIFDKLARQLEIISENSDDKDLLEKFTKKGDKLARAYAATLLLAVKGEVKYFATYKTPFSDVTYTYREGIDREKLIGVQYYDDPVLRMFGIFDIIKKKKLYVYSLNDRMICTGKDPNPPKEFINQMVNSLKTNVKPAQVGETSVYICPHLDAKKVNDGSPLKNPYLKIGWVSPDVVFGICERCARHNRENTYSKLITRIAARDVHKDFEIEVISKPTVKTKCSSCSELEEIPLSVDLNEKYMNDAINDRDLIEEHLHDFRNLMINSGKKHFILDHVCYGTDMTGFIDKLEPEEIEREALQVVLKKVPTAVIASKATPNKVLLMYWNEFGRDALFAVTGEMDFARRMFKKHDVNKTSPSQILKESSFTHKQMNIIKALPVYDRLPAVAKFADEMARTYMTKGPEDTVRAIEHYRSTDTRIKTIAFAFLLALEKGTSKEWQYTKTEKEFAEHLKNPTIRLLNADADSYHKALQDLLRATGSTEDIKPLK